MRYRIIFLKELNENLYFHGRVDLKEIKEVIQYQKRRYNIQTTKPAYIWKETCYFFYNVENGSAYNFKEVKSQIDPKALDLLMGTNIIRQITSGLREDIRNNWGLIIVSFALGFLLAFLIAMYYYTNKIDLLQEQLYANNTWNPFSIFSTFIKIMVFKGGIT
ncbi:MAG: hypothetical protein ACTSO2_13770 [Promethearchaeota archaeon]